MAVAHPTLHCNSCSTNLSVVVLVAETCSDDSRCETYTENQCANAWLMENCKSKCKLC